MEPWATELILPGPANRSDPQPGRPYVANRAGCLVEFLPVADARLTLRWYRASDVDLNPEAPVMSRIIPIPQLVHEVLAGQALRFATLHRGAFMEWKVDTSGTSDWDLRAWGTDRPWPPGDLLDPRTEVLATHNATIAAGGNAVVPFAAPYAGPATLSLYFDGPASTGLCYLLGRTYLSGTSPWLLRSNGSTERSSVQAITVPPLICSMQLFNLDVAARSFYAAVVADPTR